MTLLLAGSVLLIGGSAVALVVGWINANETFIWVSIGATAGAAALLIVAFFRSRKEAPVAATAAATPESTIDPEILADREERSQQKYQRAMTRGEEESAPPPPPTDETQASPQADPDKSDDDGDDGGPAPGSVVTSTSLGGATAVTPAPGGPQTDPDATAATVGPPAGAMDAAESGDSASGSGQVVAVPKTKKFHAPGCRFASAKGAETMDRSSAEGQGYQPCGVCKP